MMQRTLTERQKQVGLLVVLAIILVMAGSLGVWGERAGERVNGWDANGGSTMVLAAVAGAGIFSQYRRGYYHRVVSVIMAALFALVVMVVWHDWVTLEDYFNRNSRQPMEYGWGLYAALVGGVAGFVVSLYQIIRPQGQ